MDQLRNSRIVGFLHFCIIYILIVQGIFAILDVDVNIALSSQP